MNSTTITELDTGYITDTIPDTIHMNMQSTIYSPDTIPANMQSTTPYIYENLPEDSTALANPMDQICTECDECSGDGGHGNNASKIMNTNVQEFISHYGVIEQSSDSTCIHDIRNLIFGWMGTIDIGAHEFHEQSIDIFKLMSIEENFKQLYPLLDTYN